MEPYLSAMATRLLNPLSLYGFTMVFINFDLLVSPQTVTRANYVEFIKNQLQNHELANITTTGILMALEEDWNPLQVFIRGLIVRLSELPPYANDGSKLTIQDIEEIVLSYLEATKASPLLQQQRSRLFIAEAQATLNAYVQACSTPASISSLRDIALTKTGHQVAFERAQFAAQPPGPLNMLSLDGYNTAIERRINQQPVRLGSLVVFGPTAFVSAHLREEILEKANANLTPL